MKVHFTDRLTFSLVTNLTFRFCVLLNRGYLKPDTPDHIYGLFATRTTKGEEKLILWLLFQVGMDFSTPFIEFYIHVTVY